MGFSLNKLDQAIFSMNTKKIKYYWKNLRFYFPPKQASSSVTKHSIHRKYIAVHVLICWLLLLYVIAWKYLVLTDDEEWCFPCTSRGSEGNPSFMIHRGIMNPFLFINTSRFYSLFKLHNIPSLTGWSLDNVFYRALRFLSKSNAAASMVVDLWKSWWGEKLVLDLFI